MAIVIDQIIDKYPGNCFIFRQTYNISSPQPYVMLGYPLLNGYSNR